MECKAVTGLQGLLHGRNNDIVAAVLFSPVLSLFSPVLAAADTHVMAITQLTSGCWCLHRQIEKVMLPYSKEDPGKYRDYGFVHYKDRASALQAIARAEDDKPQIDGKDVTVSVVV